MQFLFLYGTWPRGWSRSLHIEQIQLIVFRIYDLDRYYCVGQIKLMERRCLFFFNAKQQQDWVNKSSDQVSEAITRGSLTNILTQTARVPMFLFPQPWALPVHQGQPETSALSAPSARTSVNSYALYTCGVVLGTTAAPRCMSWCHVIQ